MQNRTIIDRIEIEPQTGNVGVRMRKEVVDDQGNVVASEYHRAMIDAATDPVKQMEVVNLHLGKMGFPNVKSEDHAVLNAVMPTLEDLRSEKKRTVKAKE